ncbi:MAG TPA: hypothetical protein VIK77_08735 [Tissierellaceae bacterium]
MKKKLFYIALILILAFVSIVYMTNIKTRTPPKSAKLVIEQLQNKDSVIGKNKIEI